MNEKYPHPLFAKEGWPFIAGTFLVAFLWTGLVGFGFFATLFWIVFVLVLQFFRDPAREAPFITNVVVSPADGRIVKVEKTTNPYTKDASIKISIFMNIFNVHSQKVPVSGIVESVKYFPGEFLNADLDKASEQNERNAVVVRMKDGRRVTFVQVAGLVARRIVCYLQKGDEVTVGQRYGFIRFGSRLDVYLPADSEPVVSIGEKVLGTQTILAKLKD